MTVAFGHDAALATFAASLPAAFALGYLAGAARGYIARKKTRQ